jgi:hypothetical protein
MSNTFLPGMTECDEKIVQKIASVLIAQTLRRTNNRFRMSENSW